MLPFNLSFFVDSILIFALAFLIDVSLGEIPDHAHPTVWMGSIVSYVKPKMKTANPKTEKLYGVFLCVGLIGLFAGTVYLILWAVVQIPFWGQVIYIIIGAVLLKTTFALKCMRNYTYPIEKGLKSLDMSEARKWLRFIVRRDPNKLDQRHIISAAVESIAESTTDGVTSPFFFFALLGVPGAMAFRVINTLDSMVGYKDPVNVNIGWFSAKMDTITNYIPARITAIFMVAASAIYGANWRNSWRILKRDKNKTASPNAGWTISAMAGALNTQLEKEGYYALGDGETSLPEDISKSWRIMWLTAIIFGVIMVLPILAAEALLI
jgi:adenosylcobinamide-phosphate synthase